MADQDKKTSTAIAPVKPPRDFVPIESASPLFDTATFEQIQRAARAVCHSTLLPESIRGTPEQTFSNLVLIFAKAKRWDMDGMEVAQCSSIVHGKLVYEGKLVAAVLESRGIRLEYEWIGKPSDGDAYAIVVSGRPRGKNEPLTIEGTVGDWKTLEKNGNIKANWKGANAKRQLAYRGAREWARLYEPGILLGVYTEDEIDEARLNNFGRRQDAIGPAPPSLSPGFADADVQDAEIIEPGADQETPDADPPASGESPQDAQDGPPQGAAPETPAEAPEPSQAPAEDAPAAKEPPADFHAAVQGLRDTRMDGLADFPQLNEFWMGLSKVPDWPTLRAALTDIAKSDDWRRAAEVPGQALISGIRAAAFHQAQMVAQEEHATDPLYFRCFIEAAEGPAELMTVFEAFQKSKTWAGFKDNQRAIFSGAVERRLLEVK